MFDKIATGRYWDKPWSLVSGCTRCSPGCDHCWALAMERRFRKPIMVTPPGDDPYETYPVTFHEDRLAIPTRRRKPTVWAVWNDLFHASVTDEQIGNAFFVMRHNPRHIFLILTKRKPRLPDDCTWPENVWLGVTVCNQEEADAKIPYLAKIPAAIRYVSIEPMLGPVDIVRYLWRDGKKSIHWVICGGESGPGARPLHPSWVLRLLFQCKFYDIPFFFKQWGHCMPGNDFEGHQYLELPLPLDRYLALSSGHDAPHARWMR